MGYSAATSRSPQKPAANSATTPLAISINNAEISFAKNFMANIAARTEVLSRDYQIDPRSFSAGTTAPALPQMPKTLSPPTESRHSSASSSSTTKKLQADTATSTVTGSSLHSASSANPAAAGDTVDVTFTPMRSGSNASSSSSPPSSSSTRAGVYVMKSVLPNTSVHELKTEYAKTFLGVPPSQLDSSVPCIKLLSKKRPIPDTRSTRELIDQPSWERGLRKLELLVYFVGDPCAGAKPDAVAGEATVLSPSSSSSGQSSSSKPLLEPSFWRQLPSLLRTNGLTDPADVQECVNLFRSTWDNRITRIAPA